MTNLENYIQKLQKEIVKTTEFIKRNQITKVRCKNCIGCKFVNTCLKKNNL